MLFKAEGQFSAPLRVAEQEPLLPAAAFTCAAGARGDASRPCELRGEAWRQWENFHKRLGGGAMSFPHPLDRFYSLLRVHMGVPPLVGVPAD